MKDVDKMKKNRSDVTLLVVDDEELNRDLLSRRLERAGYAVQTASSGREALAMLETQIFELVLLDSMMPEMTGVDLLRLLRSTRSTSELPIIMVTALSDSERVVEALNLGANDYITKPIDMPIALARIDAQLARKRSDDALREREQRFALAVEGGNDGMWDWDLVTDRLFVSDRWRSMLGYHSPDDCKASRDWLEIIHPDDRGEFESKLSTYLETGTGEFEAECRMLHADGSLRWMHCRGLARRDSSGKAVRIAGSLSDVTTTRSFDPLTRLANRNAFRDRVSAALNAQRRDSSADFAVLLLDLDQFTMVNDRFGHQVGDQLLTDVGRRLVSSLRISTRPSPVRPGQDMVARLDGDSFAILLDRVGGQAAAEQVAERLKNELQNAFSVSGHEVFTTATIGVAYSAGDYWNQDEVLRDAGTALHRAKELGSNQLVVFDVVMRAEAVARMELESDLKKALSRHELEVYYQPKVRLTDEQLIGFEALIRWRHPARGLLMPGQFLELAESTGLIVPIGLWILRESCATIQAWRDEFPFEPPLEISVNVSLRQFREKDFADRVIEIVNECQIQPGTLNLEITESILMDDVSATLAALERMKARGVGFKIDDFGTGYSSLSYLQRLPFDSLKIDRSFVAEVDSEPGALSIVETVIRLARTMGLNIVAEGIETPEQAERLRKLGCDYGQGYLYAKPMSLELATEFLRSRTAAGCPQSKTAPAESKTQPPVE